MLKSWSKTPVAVAIVILSFACPTELSLFVGSLRLPPHRLALIAFAIPAIIYFFGRGRARITAFDLLFLAYNLWTVGVFMIHLGASDGFEFGGSLAVESFGGYLIARAYVRDLDSFRASLGFLVFTVAAVALLALPETLSGRILVHDWLRAMTGYYHPIGVETRLGLTRAYSTFDHPILYGTFCASLLTLLWVTGNSNSQRLTRAGLLTGATYLGLSSAPLLCLMVQSAIIVWEKLTRGMRGRVGVSVGLLAAGYLVLEVFSSRPAYEAIVTRITIDSWTAFYRIQIWTFGIENIKSSPWIGIGLADWQRASWMASSSVDAFWLLIPMRTGLPSLLLLLAAIALLVRSVHRGRDVGTDETLRRLAFAWTTSLIALGLAALTVHYWNAIHAYCFFFLGLGGWLANPLPQSAVQAVSPLTASSPPVMRPSRRRGGRFAQPA